ncbi:MAG TPA: type IV toxin-antitoxin system AbiEi family antitoxin domain-containing protein [Pseudonocardiaceae bacterium]|jgi:predicted transcriptional regulator of viral defense system
MAKAVTLTTLADLAEDQWGLITKDQAESIGVAWSTISRLRSQGVLDRVARGVYRLRGTPPADHLELRAAWLQLAPHLPAWDRGVDLGAVSHRSAASVYGLGHLPADRHEFVLPVRRQTRRADVRLHRGHLERPEWTALEGLPVTRPRRIAADLLAEREDPAAVGHVVADALRQGADHPRSVAGAIAPHAARYGLARHDGFSLLSRLLELTGDPQRSAWLKEARA